MKPLFDHAAIRARIKELEREENPEQVAKRMFDRLTNVRNSHFVEFEFDGRKYIFARGIDDAAERFVFDQEMRMFKL